MNKRLFHFRTALLVSVIFASAAQAQAEETLSRTTDHDYDAPAPGTYQLPVIKTAADAALLDAAGKPINLRNLTRDRITVLSFIYTRCASAKACPMATGVLMDLHLSLIHISEPTRP